MHRTRSRDAARTPGRGRSRSGFTLIELIVVVVILAVLAAIGVVSYNHFVGQSRDAATLASAKQVATALDAAAAQDGSDTDQEASQLWNDPSVNHDSAKFLSAIKAAWNGGVTYLPGTAGAAGALQLAGANGRLACLSLGQTATATLGKCTVTLAAPSLTASGAHAAINLSWTAISGATSYSITRDGAPLTSVTGTTYSDTGLADGVTHAYTVAAVTGGTAGTVSNSATAATTIAAPAGFTAQAASAVVSTFAGSGFSTGITSLGGGTGQTNSAASLNLSTPTGEAVDSAGNVYMTDASWDAVFKISPAGKWSIYAGSPDTSDLTGEASAAGYGGDGGPATAAKLWNPTGLAFDSAGNLYIADTKNYRVRKVTPAGVISTIAGTGAAETGSTSGDGGPATSATLNAPQGVTVDNAGNVYIADTGANTIRKITAGGTIATVAGIIGSSGSTNGALGTNKLNSPRQLATDSAGNVYIADYGSTRIRKLGTDGTVSTVVSAGFGSTGDGGQATAAKIGQVQGILVDPAGNLYLSDGAPDYRVRKVDMSTGVITGFAGSTSSGYADGVGSAAKFSALGQIARGSDGSLYVADTSNKYVRRLTPGGANLSWTAVAGASSYTVKRNGTTLGTTASASYSDASAVPGTSYTYTVTATVSGATSDAATATLTP